MAGSCLALAASHAPATPACKTFWPPFKCLPRPDWEKKKNLHLFTSQQSNIWPLHRPKSRHHSSPTSLGLTQLWIQAPEQRLFIPFWSRQQLLDSSSLLPTGDQTPVNHVSPLSSRLAQAPSLRATMHPRHHDENLQPKSSLFQLSLSRTFWLALPMHAG